MKRTLDLELVPVSANAAEAGDRCAFDDCPTGILEWDADRGELVCTDCRIAADDAYEMAQAALAVRL